MSDGANSMTAGQAVSVATVSDFIALMKPRVMSLVVFTALVGLVVAPGAVHPLTGLTALLCIAVGAGAAGALNMWYDADIDRRMQRTAMRPIPRGRVSPDEALAFGATLGGGSILVLGVLVNWVAAALLALTIGFYLFVYTMWLKRRTPQNIVIGGAAGAFPPLIGWAAATGTVELEPLVLFALIFVWTPPHFWALALYRARDYERAGVPMLPVVAGEAVTRRQILAYSLVLTAVAFVPLLLGTGGLAYGVAATVFGAVFLNAAWQVYRRREGAAADRAAKRLFGWSIVYLFALFAALLADAVIGPAMRAMGLPG